MDTPNTDRSQVKTSMALTIDLYPPHTKDSDCSVDEETGECLICCAWGSEPCSNCGGVRFHNPGCPEIDGLAVAVNF